MPPVRSTFASSLIACVLALGHPAPAGQIAFLRLTDGFWQVWAMKDDGTHLRQLTSDPVDKSKVQWAPGGKDLVYTTNLGAYARLKIAGCEKPPCPAKPLKLTLIDAVSSASFALSPDGRHLALATNTYDTNLFNDLWILDLPSGKKWKIGANEGKSLNSPAFSKDGTVLVYREAKAMGTEGASQSIVWRELGPEVGRKVIDGAKLKKGVLVDDYPFNFDEVPSPAGEVAFSSSRSGSYEIWVVYPEHKPHQITHLGAFSAAPSWSPGGGSIAFESDKSGSLQIWVMRRDGSGAKQLTHDDVESRRPFWGPE